MKNILFCCCCLVTIFSVQAAEQQYWVLGSFTVLAGASKERGRLENITGLPVHIATFTDSYTTRYRLVVQRSDDQDQRQMLRMYGVAAWRMSIDPQQIDLSGTVNFSSIVNNTSVQRPLREFEEAPSAGFSSPPEPHSEPAPDQQLQHQVLAIDVSAMSRSEFFEFCSIKATRSQRGQYCKNSEVKQKAGQ